MFPFVCESAVESALAADLHKFPNSARCLPLTLFAQKWFGDSSVGDTTLLETAVLQRGKD